MFPFESGVEGGIVLNGTTGYVLKPTFQSTRVKVGKEGIYSGLYFRVRVSW